jgi:hypothetical protein
VNAAILAVAPVLAVATFADEQLPAWAQWGILGLIIISLVVTRQIVPGWTYDALVKQRDASEARCLELQNENNRLRDAATRREREWAAEWGPLIEKMGVLLQRTPATLDKVVEKARADRDFEGLADELREVVRKVEQWQER